MSITISCYYLTIIAIYRLQDPISTILNRIELKYTNRKLIINYYNRITGKAGETNNRSKRYTSIQNTLYFLRKEDVKKLTKKQHDFYGSLN